MGVLESVTGIIPVAVAAGVATKVIKGSFSPTKWQKNTFYAVTRREAVEAVGEDLVRTAKKNPEVAFKTASLNILAPKGLNTSVMYSSNQYFLGEA